MMKKILLTGYKGFIGSHMLASLNKKYNVTTYDWAEGTRPSVLGFDWVIHIGANSATTERNIDLIMRQNYEFSVELYEECRKFGVNMQYSSSASVYGLGVSFSETSPPDPRTPYAWTKYLFDRYAENNPSGFITQGFRYFNVYGTNEEHKGTQASPVTQFRKQARESGKFKLFKNSESYLRDFICVEDIVDTQLTFMDNVNTSGIWNIGTGRTASFQDIANIVAIQENAKIVYVDMPDNLKPGYQKYTCADLTKLNSTIGERNWTTVEEWMYKNGI